MPVLVTIVAYIFTVFPEMSSKHLLESLDPVVWLAAEEELFGGVTVAELCGTMTAAELCGVTTEVAEEEDEVIGVTVAAEEEDAVTGAMTVPFGVE